MQSSGSSLNSCFTTHKDIQKKFPLRPACQYSYPLLQPQGFYSQDSVQHSLGGNCLDVVETGDGTVVVHVDISSEGRQAVVVSRLMPGRYYQSDEPVKDCPFFHLEKQNNVLVGQSVYQVISKSLHNDAWVLVRCPTLVHLASLGQSEFSNMKLETGESLTSDVSLNSVVPGLWSLVTVDGEITLRDVEARQPLWMAQCRKPEKVKNESARIFKCDFGRHPLNLFVANESSLWFYDTRMAPEASKSLFDVKKVTTHENICSFIPANDRPHLYAVLDESVYVVDERQRKAPLMHWRHMLSERPKLSTINKLGSLEILMLSCTQSKEVCMISSEWERGRQQWHGVSVPCHFPILRDTTAFAHSHSLWFTNQVQERLEDSTWLGVASLTHPIESDTLLFLSLQSSGDIFSHSFQTLRTKGDSAMAFDDKQGQDILSKWEKDAVDVSTHNWASQNVQRFNVTGFFHQILKPSSRHIEDMLAGLPEVEFNYLNGSTNSMEIVGSSKLRKAKPVSINFEKGAKMSKKILNGNKSTDCNKKNSQKESSYIWNLKDQVQKCRSQWGSKSKRGAAWNNSLMESYVINPVSDPSTRLPVHLNDRCSEDSLGKFLPQSMIKDLKLDKIKSCEHFLSKKITALWFGEDDAGIREKEDETGKDGTSDGRLSNLIGIQTSARRHGFQYHTAPVDLTDLSTRFTTSGHHHVGDALSPELHESFASPPQAVPKHSQKTPSQSKKISKKTKKKKRVDGF